ncbi:MAG: 2-hydroxyhepta-2,4-diene-1,7-dioate isomerase [Planctomycetes bacterium]|nr:2-hydroxyhepta-2,4-diene-1,7-dioate isomerase [Planctomycetota bacterium]
MRIAKIRLGAEEHLALVEEDRVRILDLDQVEPYRRLCDVLHAPDPVGLAQFLVGPESEGIPVSKVTFLAPIDEQEVWAAGVTYRRSQVARMEESKTGASHYDRVYTADRPELFFKATPHRVAGPGEPIRIRADSRWTVPEPELTLVISPQMKLVGFTIGNDVSARDIEGENPLYLPQAKVYRQCCALGPWVLLANEPLDLKATEIRLLIERRGESVYEGRTHLDRMARSFDELIEWLGRENEFPSGVFLLTGTGIVPPDSFSLEHGDVVHIDVTGIGRLTNPVVQDDRRVD